MAIGKTRETLDAHSCYMWGVSLSETRAALFSHILFNPFVFWTSDYINTVPLACLKSISAKRWAMCIEAERLSFPLSCSRLAPALLRAALLLLPSTNRPDHLRNGQCSPLSCLMLDFPGWDGLNQAEEMVFWFLLKMGCFGGKPFCWWSYWCFTRIHICSLRTYNE